MATRAKTERFSIMILGRIIGTCTNSKHDQLEFEFTNFKPVKGVSIPKCPLLTIDLRFAEAMVYANMIDDPVYLDILKILHDVPHVLNL